MTKTTNEYVNNQKLLEALKDYKTKVKIAEEQGKSKPIPSNYIGQCVTLIADHLGTMPKFNGYTFLDEMKGDGIENVFLYLDNFDPDKYNNPFAYFTKIIYYAFLRRIAKEKKQLYVKYKQAANYGIFDAVTNTDSDSETTPFEMYDNLVEFIEEFEAKKKEKKSKKTKGIEEFMNI